MKKIILGLVVFMVFNLNPIPATSDDANPTPFQCLYALERCKSNCYREFREVWELKIACISGCYIGFMNCFLGDPVGIL